MVHIACIFLDVLFEVACTDQITSEQDFPMSNLGKNRASGGMCACGVWYRCVCVCSACLVGACVVCRVNV